jgi:ABC-type multidrug transport system fused ATPase/permease subunit
MTIFALCRKPISLLSKRHKTIFITAIFLQLLINLSDIMAIGLITIIGSLASSYIVGTEQEIWIKSIINFFNLTEVSIEVLIFYNLCIVVFLFIFKSVFASLSMLQITKFLSRRQLEISDDLINRITYTKYSWLKKQNSQKIIYTVTDGVHSFISGVLGNLASLISDVTLFVMVVLIIFVINLETAVFIAIFFSLVLFVSGKYTQKLSLRFGTRFAESSVANRNSLTPLLNSVRETTLTGNQKFFTRNLYKNLKINSEARGLSTWVQQLPKSIFEIALVVGAFALLLFQFRNNNFGEALTLILVFLVASGRLIPALMRIQSSVILIRSHQAGAEMVVRLIDELSKENVSNGSDSRQIDLSAAPSIKFNSVFYSFDDDLTPVIQDFSLEIMPGQLVALVGPTGSGKTTLIDLMLGFYSPDSGSIDFKTENLVLKPNSIRNIAYVPQMPVLISGTIRENIEFGNTKLEDNDNKLQNVIRYSGLDSVLDRLPMGLETSLDQIGNIISGGELQRISIARALYLNSKFIVLDEATSSLDGGMEKNITNYLNSLKKYATIVVVAHRLSSIKTADVIIYLDGGKIKGTGNFTDLQNKLPDFAQVISDMRF